MALIEFPLTPVISKIRPPPGPPDGVLDAPDEVLRGVPVHPPPLGAPGASPVHNVYVVGHVLGGGKPGHLQAQQIFTLTLSYCVS